jgi:NifU-like protein involved in Fe-S cluster formation
LEEERKRLSLLSSLRDYPARLKCAMLAWHAMLVALGNPRE